MNSVDVMNYYESEQFNSITVRKVTTDSPTIKGKCGKKLNYILNPITGYLTISGNGSMHNYTESISPFKVNIIQVNIEEGATTIGDYAFYTCKSLSTINIPASVTSIGEYSFYGCTSLSTLTLPKVNSIGSNAFYQCTSLRSVSFLNNISHFGINAFTKCSLLSRVIYHGTDFPPNNYIFINCDNLKSSEVIYNYKSDKFLEIPIVKRIIPTDKFNIYICLQPIH